MQLISQENPAMEINRFEGNRLKWLVPGGTPFAFGRGRDFERERGKKPIDTCLPNQLSVFSFSFFLYFRFFLLSFLSFLFPYFLFCDPSQVVVIVVLAFFLLFPLLCARQRPLFIAPAVAGFYCFSP